MNIAYIAYNIIGFALCVLIFPLYRLYTIFGGSRRAEFEERLGIYPPCKILPPGRSPRIWFHAASVGEVGVARTIIEALKSRVPSTHVMMTTMTEAGRSVARTSLDDDALCLLAPLDLPIPVKKAFDTLRPDLLVCLETEIWPNLFGEAGRRGIKSAIVNGRISDRSIRRYLSIRPMTRHVLKKIEAFSMITDIDAHRIGRIGAPPGRITVNGNAKYDLIFEQTDTGPPSDLIRLYDLRDDHPVIVAGSVRGTEADLLLNVFAEVKRSFPAAVLILAPRHIRRASRILSRAKTKGFTCQLRSGIDDRQRTAQIVILDTIGELQATYSVATVVFCGGSLVPMGGQNPLEAAGWGKPVLFGPSMEDFQDATALLTTTGGGIRVENERELTDKILYFLTNPSESDRVGKKARQALLAHRGAAHKHAAVIAQLLASNG